MTCYLRGTAMQELAQIAAAVLLVEASPPINVLVLSVAVRLRSS